MSKHKHNWQHIGNTTEQSRMSFKQIAKFICPDCGKYKEIELK